MKGRLLDVGRSFVIYFLYRSCPKGRWEISERWGRGRRAKKFHQSRNFVIDSSHPAEPVRPSHKRNFSSSSSSKFHPIIHPIPAKIPHNIRKEQFVSKCLREAPHKDTACSNGILPNSVSTPRPSSKRTLCGRYFLPKIIKFLKTAFLTLGMDMLTITIVKHNS